MMPTGHPYADRGYGSIQSISTTTTTNTTNTSSDLTAGSSSSLSSTTDYTTHPLIRTNDRVYLRDPDNPYPLPCDLAEIHRQTLRSLTLMRVFGAPFSAKSARKRPPRN